MANDVSLTTNCIYKYEGNMKWKYAMISIEHESIEPGYCELVELFFSEGGDKPFGFCKARIHSLDELERALEDVRAEGIVSYFSKHGSFSRNSDDNFWDWNIDERYLDKSLADCDIGSYEDEIELYTVYGGD
jgi:hypothetical protein